MSALYEVRGSIAVITLNNPPVNGLGLATRQALMAALDQAEADPAVRALVLTGAGAAFSGGADIKEFGSPKAMSEPHLPQVVARVEGCSKPVVAAVHSVCMGGGLELALSCHYRVFARGSKLALPEVKLGLLPGAGGTQRLPRVLGVEAALKLIVSGEVVSAEQLAAQPGQRLVDRLVEPAVLLDEALALASEVAAARPLPRVSALVAHLEAPAAFFAATRAELAAAHPHHPAPLRCLEAVEAVVMLPFEQGLRVEREGFTALMASPVSKALRHAFVAERAAAKIADLPPDTPLREIRSVAVIGAGTMGGGIAQCFLEAGLPVVLLDGQAEALTQAQARIRGNFEAQLRKGRLRPEQLEARMALLRCSQDEREMAGADLLIEAVFEDLAVKRQVFERMDALAKPDAILASNTSTLNIDTLAGCTQRPASVLGLHFFSPAPVMALLEVVRGAATAPDVLATAMALAKKIRKIAVVARVCDGFIGNRMLEAYLRQAGQLLDEGCLPEQVDQAAEAFGMAMGPFRMSDLAGNDISWAIRKRRAQEQPGRHPVQAADRLCEVGRFGQKTQAGWYDYLPGSREARPSPAVAALLAEHRAALGLPQPETAPGAEAIVERLMLALINEGARVLEEGVAQRASDIDMVYLSGYGFPRWRGGPLCHAEQLGLGAVVQALERLAQERPADAAFWSPAPLLRRLAAEGRGFQG